MGSYKGPIMILVVLIAVLGAVVGYKYFKYTEEQPEFCSSCHLMQEAVKSWQRSKHRNFVCQVCHKMGILEQNKLLVAFVVNPKGKIKQNHGKINPWSVCKDCHMQAAAQGSITLRNSYGHAKHVFMQQLSCEKCHKGDMHEFKVTKAECIACHKDKLIHGMGMSGLACLNCHNYAESAPKMIATKKCLQCHEDVPKGSPMSGLKCFECHKPHGKLKMETQDCLGSCHGNESKVGQHGLHMKKAKTGCLDCHKAHTWTIGKKQAIGLCDRCHKLKDPASFIY
jgi:cytochrome c nitrite reductase small subunit